MFVEQPLDSPGSAKYCWKLYFWCESGSEVALQLMPQDYPPPGKPQTGDQGGVIFFQTGAGFLDQE